MKKFAIVWDCAPKSSTTWEFCETKEDCLVYAKDKIANRDLTGDFAFRCFELNNDYSENEEPTEDNGKMFFQETFDM